MPSNRIRQVNSEIHREVAQRIGRLKDPRIAGLVSVVRVDTSRDLSSCKIYVSAMDNEEEVLKGLKSAAGFLRHEIGQALDLRHMPELRFLADDSIRHGFEIYSAMEQIERQEGEET